MALGLLAANLFAAAIDGKWKGEAKIESKKKEATTVGLTFDLKADGDKLTGSVLNSAGKRGRTLDVTEGKLDGNSFTFVTVQKSRKKGDVRVTWTGTVEGDELKGSYNAGRKRSTEFTAKRQ
ncbi:MAG: hypothetical protein JNK87_08305 [Bryobacterales bacterium]|nr:hypothetical protein [Bryobacterales bacterium]